MPDQPLEILTPDHPNWRDFCDRLAGPEGCDFQGERADTTWRCAGGRNQDYSRAILQSMTGIDVDATLRYFSEHGGHCDCEVLFNVDPSEDPAAPAAPAQKRGARGSPPQKPQQPRMF